jgi:hypothetical protein
MSITRIVVYTALPIKEALTSLQKHWHVKVLLTEVLDLDATYLITVKGLHSMPWWVQIF